METIGIIDKPKNNISKNGDIFTPNFIVNNMLDMINYEGQKILCKNIIDNSCGEGAFLIEIVRRYINACRERNIEDNEIKLMLETYVHGIEKNKLYYERCIINLNNVLVELNFFKTVKWNIINGDALKNTEFNNKMDYVVGNPPYIRIHDLDSDLAYRNFNFSKNGMTDLFIIFYEIGLNMLNEKGFLCYITPNSYFTSKAAFEMRKTFISNNYLRSVVNLKHFNPFKNTSTYTAITIISKCGESKIKYYNYDDKKIVYMGDLRYCDFCVNGEFYFDKKEKLEWFKEIMSVSLNENIIVKNGVSTNLDSFFFNKSYKGKYIKDAIKISKMEKTKVFYPYDNFGNLISLEDIKKNDNEFFLKLNFYKDKLLARSLQNQPWYGFARSQGLRDFNFKKIIINNIVKTIDGIKIDCIDGGVVVYSGYYLMSNFYDYELIIKLIKDGDFIQFLKILGKDKNGEYYFFSTIDLWRYISYKIKKVS